MAVDIASWVLGVKVFDFSFAVPIFTVYVNLTFSSCPPAKVNVKDVAPRVTFALSETPALRNNTVPAGYYGVDAASVTTDAT